MKRVIYMALTLASALSLGGCSSALTTKDLTIIEEAENLKAEQAAIALTDESNDDTIPSAIPELMKETTTSVTTAHELSNLTIEIEGNEEIIPVRNYSSSLGYQIKIDEERFTHEAVEGSDIYSAVNPDNSVYPEIYIKITKTDKSEYNDYKGELKRLLLQENPQAKELSDTKIGTYNAEGFQSNYGNDYNSAIKKVSVIETIVAYYTIETQYFLEAAEGYGARIEALLNTFTINE